MRTPRKMAAAAAIIGLIAAAAACGGNDASRSTSGSPKSNAEATSRPELSFEGVHVDSDDLDAALGSAAKVALSTAAAHGGSTDKTFKCWAISRKPVNDTQIELEDNAMCGPVRYYNSDDGEIFQLAVLHGEVSSEGGTPRVTFREPYSEWHTRPTPVGLYRPDGVAAPEKTTISTPRPPTITEDLAAYIDLSGTGELQTEGNVAKLHGTGFTIKVGIGVASDEVETADEGGEPISWSAPQGSEFLKAPLDHYQGATIVVYRGDKATTLDVPGSEFSWSGGSIVLLVPEGQPVSLSASPEPGATRIDLRTGRLIGS